MSEEEKTKTPDNTADASGGYQTTIDEETRKTGVAAEDDVKSTARPEAPENDSVPGSPNQGTESR
ncbi:hypothetical protein PI95_005260 [Hassallia byssoidea VB512170]|uniref:Uncharacterized protein n=1 Tax=Hassallia byssoidea VB512170 TaxID=1304833 RepID=A0A846H4T2_9CYAN|nr:hypothetical protein [Hassalia byssoidea]NEU71998.1 hypothetical protein [Hassalia byssoidea VB512170]